MPGQSWLGRHLTIHSDRPWQQRIARRAVIRRGCPLIRPGRRSPKDGIRSHAGQRLAPAPAPAPVIVIVIVPLPLTRPRRALVIAPPVAARVSQPGWSRTGRMRHRLYVGGLGRSRVQKRGCQRSPSRPVGWGMSRRFTACLGPIGHPPRLPRSRSEPRRRTWHAMAQPYAGHVTWRCRTCQGLVLPPGYPPHRRSRSASSRPANHRCKHQPVCLSPPHQPVRKPGRRSSLNHAPNPAGLPGHPGARLKRLQDDPLFRQWISVDSATRP